MTIEQKSFEGWGIVELMGHVRLAGRVSPAPMYGTELIRIDVPEADSFTTQYASGASLYRLTPCSEEVARAVAGANQVIPVHPWEIRRIGSPKQAGALTEFFYGACPACRQPHSESDEVTWMADGIGRYFYCPMNGDRVDLAAVINRGLDDVGDERD